MIFIRNYKKFIVITLMVTLLLAGCQKGGESEYKAYDQVYLDSFDTVIKVIVHTKSTDEASKYFQMIHSRLLELDDYYNIYNGPKNGNNLFTLNEKAGKEPVKLPKETIDLLIMAQDSYNKYSNKTDITIGPVTAVWHKHREGHVIEGGEHSEEAPHDGTLPTKLELEAAAKHMGMSHLIIDEKAGTAFLTDENARVDVGAVAKGYAVELVAKEAEAAGLEAGIISAGGNVRTIGKPLLANRNLWAVGIENPDIVAREKGKPLVDVLFIGEGAVVTSGDYQRFYMVDGKSYHHLIDPVTLFPGEHSRSVTIFCEDSGLGDFLSTAVFLMPHEEGEKLIESIPGAEALWVFKDGSTKFSSGMAKYLESQGAKP
ncbi:MAG: FAD:protein FMN transferase [Tissierellia bacterium]|nr:FAD:protein FMN transferase [Tissierellia bacterium]